MQIFLFIYACAISDINKLVDECTKRWMRHNIDDDWTDPYSLGKVCMHFVSYRFKRNKRNFMKKLS